MYKAFLSGLVSVIFLLVAFSSCGGSSDNLVGNAKGEVDIEATVEARVQEQLAKADPTDTPLPTDTPTPTSTSTPIPPTVSPTPSPVPTPTPSPVLPSSQSILKKSQGIMERLDSFQYEVEMGIKSGEFELPMGYKGRFKAPESLYSTLSANIFGLSITGDFIKIGDDYYEKEFMGEWASTGEFEGIDPREFWTGEDNLLSLPIASEPTKLYLEGVEVYKISWDLSDMGSGGPSAGILSLLNIAGDGMPSEMLVEYWIDADSSHLRKFAVSMEGDADDMDFSGLPIEADTVTISMEFHLTAFNEEGEPIVAPIGLLPAAPVAAAPALPTPTTVPTPTGLIESSSGEALAKTHYVNGRDLQKEGQHSEAVEEYTKAIELDPDVGIIYFSRAAAFKELGNMEEAIADISMAIKLDPNESAPYNLRGHIYQLLGQHEESIPDFDKAIELNPKEPGIYNNRGNAYREVGQYEESIADFNKAIERNPSYFEAYNNRGHSYYEMGQYQDAISEFDKAIELSPAFSHAYQNRGAAYAALGESTLSQNDLAKACELDEQFCSSPISSTTSDCDPMSDRDLLVSGFTFQGEPETFLKINGSGVVEGNSSGVAGSYQRFPTTNDWHKGEIVAEGDCYYWKNEADQTWPLYPDFEECRFETNDQNPYFTEAPYFTLFSLSGDQSCKKKSSTLSNNITTSQDFSVIEPGVHLLGRTRISDEGVSYGTAVISDGQDFDLGPGEIRYSHVHTSGGAGIGYFYAYDGVRFGNLVSSKNASCETPFVSYSGVDISRGDLELGQLELDYIGEGPKPRDRNDWADRDKPLMFGTLFSDCYSGTMVFEKDGIFGAIDPFYMYDNGDVVIRWWVNGTESIGFDYAPVKFVVSPTLFGSLVNNSEGSLLNAWEVVVSGGASSQDFGGIHLLPDLRNLVIYDEGDDDLLGFAKWFGDLPSLENLDLSGRGLKTLDALQSMPPLKGLNLHASEITDIGPIKHQTSLEYVNLSRNNITDISPLMDITNLESLHLGENPLSTESINTYILDLRTRGVEVHLD